MMSSDGQGIERAHSDYSSGLSSRRGSSEMGSSHYSAAENGVFLSTFAAIVFLSGAVTIGVSLLSLIIALSAMLQSCEKKNPGILEATYSNNYDYCKNWASHAELNGFIRPNNDDDFCKDANTEYVEKGHYLRDLNQSIRIAQDYLFNGPRQLPQDYSRDCVVVMMDADDLIFEATFDSQLTNGIIKKSDVFRKSYYLKQAFVLTLYATLQSQGWPIILFSRKSEELRNATVELLTSVGCDGWSSLVMRKQNEANENYEECLSSEKVRLQSEGFRIVAVISSRMDAVRTRQFGERFFKIPNPIFLPYKIQDHQAQKIY